MTDDYDVVDPTQRQIYKFIKTLFHAAQLTAECAIITLVGNVSILIELIMCLKLKSPKHKML